MRQLQRQHIDVGLGAVVRWQPVIGVVRDRGGRRAQVRYARIGHVVLVLVQVVQREGGRSAHAHLHARSNAPAAVAVEGPAGHALMVDHAVQPHGHAVADHVVDVAGGADLVVGPTLDHARLLVGHERQLGDLVDHPAGGSAAEQGRGRAFVDLDGVQIEGVAGVVAGVAKAIQEEVVVGREAAQVHRVAVGPALAGVQGDAGDVLQRLLQVGQALLLHQHLGDDVDGLGGVLHRLGQQAEGGLAGGDHHVADLVGRGRVGQGGVARRRRQACGRDLQSRQPAPSRNLRPR